MKKNILILLAIMATVFVKAQDSSRLYVTTGIGLNKIKGSLHNTFRSSVAFNSALETPVGKNGYGQAELNFNTLTYNQQHKDDNSAYLFRNTNSSLLLLGINGGRNFKWGAFPWFSSVYLGTGYVSVGEPRITIDEDNKIVTQSVARRAGIFGKGGLRIGFITRSKIFQTLYLDGAYWTSTIHTQGGTLRGLSLFAGMRMSMK